MEINKFVIVLLMGYVSLIMIVHSDCILWAVWVADNSSSCDTSCSSFHCGLGLTDFWVSVFCTLHEISLIKCDAPAACAFRDLMDKQANGEIVSGI